MKDPRCRPAYTDVSSNAVMLLLQKIYSRSTCGLSAIRVKARCWGQGKAFLHLYTPALWLENTSVSSTAVLMKSTAGTVQLDFLTEHYGLSGGLSYI